MLQEWGIISPPRLLKKRKNIKACKLYGLQAFFIFNKAV